MALRLHHSSIDCSFGVGVVTGGVITLNHSSVTGVARETTIRSGDTITLNQSFVGGRQKSLSGAAAVIARNSELGWIGIDVGPGGILMLINSSGSIDLPDGPVEIDTAIIVGNEFQGFTIGDFEVAPFDWGGVMPEHCTAERNVPPVTCPFGSGS